MNTCCYCDNVAVTCIPVRVGDAPADPKHEGTQADHRKVEVIRLCADHKDAAIQGLQGGRQ